MAPFAPQTFAEAAVGRAEDHTYWSKMQKVQQEGWEGDEQRPSMATRRSQDTGLMTWNVGRQLTNPGGRAAGAKERTSWFAALQMAHQTGNSIVGFQELGSGGSTNDEQRVRAIVAEWSKATNVTAHIWMAGAPGWLDGKDLRALGGPPSGMAIIAFGAWARRGRAARAWANGRGLWVEFHEGARQLCVGNVYGPSGVSASASEPWRQDVSEERAEAAARGCTTVVMGDFNCRRSYRDSETAKSADSEIDAWFQGEEFGDVWIMRHGERPGFTRQPDDSRTLKYRSRIDYICVDPDLPPSAITGAWLGPWGRGGTLDSDHRPLMCTLDTELWLGSTAARTPTKYVDEEMRSAYPPRHWFYSGDADRKQAADDKAEQRLPRKLPREALTAAMSAGTTLAAMAALNTAIIRQTQSTGAHSQRTAVVWEAKLAVGRALSAVLEPQIRKRTEMGASDSRLPDWARGHLRIRGLRKWLKRIKAKGESLFYRGTADRQAEIFNQIPEELWDLWHEAIAAQEHSADGRQLTKEETKAVWQRTVDKVVADERKGTAASRDSLTHAELKELQSKAVAAWLIDLLRVRISTATAGLRKELVKTKTQSQMKRRLAEAYAAVQGRTGAVFENINPRTRPIRVDGAMQTMGDGTRKWCTDDDSLRRNAAEICGNTTSIDGRPLRGTKLSPEARAAGQVDDQFHAPELRTLREVVLERKPAIDRNLVVSIWTAERLYAAVEHCADKAPGPSGLCYWMIAEGTADFRKILARMINLFQDLNTIPAAARHGFVYPIPKPGAGGSTFEGARQIVLLECITKLISGSIAVASMAIWEDRGYLHAAQAGFRKAMAAGDCAAAVVAVQALYRDKGLPLHTVAADITKAFQSVGLPQIEMALRRLGLPEDVTDLWMQTDRGEWTAPATNGANWGATYATCQVITPAGLSPDFETEGGVRQGDRGSPYKFLAWIDMLWCWLDREGIKGVELEPGNPNSMVLTILGFADDIWVASSSFEELQRSVHLIDIFLAAFDVELNPGKSMYAAINCEQERQIGLYRFVDGVKTLVPLQTVPQTQGFRYLGIMMQPNGGWQAMTATVMGKIRAWTAQVGRSQLAVDHAVMILRSVVGGYLNYVLSAAPLGNTVMERIDKLVAAAIFKCAGLAKGRRTAWAFVDGKMGGFGATSAVSLRRAIVLDTVLTKLNVADDRSCAQ